MEQTPPPQVITKKAKKSNMALKVIPWVGLGLFIITLAAGGYLYATKKLAFTFGGTPTRSVVAVCGDAIISKYNDAMNYKIRDSGTTSKLDEVGLNNLEKEVTAKSAYAQDPTCQTILFWIAVQHSDGNKAQAALASLNTLHSGGKYVDSNLNNNAPLSTFKNIVDYLTAGPRNSK